MRSSSARRVSRVNLPIILDAAGYRVILVYGKLNSGQGARIDSGCSYKHVCVYIYIYIHIYMLQL